jgi:hypothetical protein
LSEVDGDPKEKCTLSLERWHTLLEGVNPKEVRIPLKRVVALSLTLVELWRTFFDFA